MNQYYQEQITAIQKWKAQEPSVVSKAMGIVTKPVAKLTELVVPTKAIEGLLSLASMVAEATTDKNDIIRDGQVENIIDLQTKSLELSDKLAHNVAKWARGAAGAEGAATGATGLPGIAADVAFIIPFAMRTISKIALCYGYECQGAKGTRTIYSIMSVAGSNTVKEKAIAIANLQMIKVMIAKTTWKKMSEKAAQNAFCKEAIAVQAKNLAKQLGVNLTKKKATQSIPYVGAAVGLAMNIAFINDVIDAAIRFFQEKWLTENGLWIEVE